MSVQKTQRLEIRLAESLKNDIQRYCDAHDIDVTYYVTTLIRSHLKKADALTVEKKVQHRWAGDIDDMPTVVEQSNRHWKRIA